MSTKKNGTNKLSKERARLVVKTAVEDAVHETGLSADVILARAPHRTTASEWRDSGVTADHYVLILRETLARIRQDAFEVLGMTGMTEKEKELLQDVFRALVRMSRREPSAYAILALTLTKDYRAKSARGRTGEKAEG